MNQQNNSQTGAKELKVPSPCIGVCALDKHDLCIACHRTGMEIAEWGVYSNDEKRAVYEKIRQREQDSLVK